MKTKIIDKIKKLLALSESNFENEANIALTKALELLKEYNLTMADIQNSTLSSSVQFSGIVVSDNDAIALVHAIAKLYFCESVYVENKGCVIIGQDINILSSKIMFEYLNECITKFSKGKKSAYRQGLIFGLIRRIILLRNSKLYSDCKDIVLSNSKANSDFLKDNFSDIGNRAGKMDKSGRDFGQGLVDSARIGLHSQIQKNDARCNAQIG